MDLLERGFTWLIVAVLLVGIAGAIFLWLPQLQRPAPPGPTPTFTAVTIAATPAKQPSATPLPSPAPQVTPTSESVATPTPTKRLAVSPAAAEPTRAGPSAPLGPLARTSNANRTTSAAYPATGTYSYTFVDAETASGASMVFARSYNSDDPKGTSLGPGWSHSFAVRIEAATDGTLDAILIGPAGGKERFSRRSDGTYVSPPGVQAELARAAGDYELSRPDGSVWTFDGAGKLTALASASGAETSLSYGGSPPRLTRVSDPDSRGSLSLAYDAKTGRLSSVADWLEPQRVVKFGYDAQGRLASVADRDGRVTRYSYRGSSHLLTSVTDARGRVVAAIGYDDKGRVASLKDAHAKSAAQALTLSYRSVADGGTEVTSTYPPSGLEPGFRSTSVETFDRSGLLVRRVSRPSSQDEALTEVFAYAEDGTLTSTTRSGGSTQRPRVTPTSQQGTGLSLLELPRPALVTTLLDALARVDVGSFVHLEDAFGRVAAFDAPVDLSNPFVRNGTWLLEYDAEDRLRFVKAPSGDQQGPAPGRASALGPRLAAPTPVVPDLELRYDQAGNLVEIVEPSGKSSKYRYDERDLLVEARLSTGETYEFAYDDRGDPLRVRVVSAARQLAAEYAFDGLRRLRRVSDYPRWPDRSGATVSETVYDDRGGSSVVVYSR